MTVKPGVVSFWALEEKAGCGKAGNYGCCACCYVRELWTGTLCVCVCMYASARVSRTWAGLSESESESQADSNLTLNWMLA